MTKRKHDEEVSSKHSHNKKHKKDSDFSIIRASTTVSIPPVFASNAREGVLEMLDSMIMRYIPSLEGVVLTHSNLQFLQSTAILQYDCPYAKCSVAFDATMWSPTVGQQLSGKVILYSPDHISLLVHRTFNVSIPRHHIPSEKYSFQWGEAEKLPPETEHDAVDTNAEADDVIMTNGGDVSGKDFVEGDDGVDEENLGSWIDDETRKPLGPVLKFTVIGLTVANQMLSLIGSLQPDPFSPRHVPVTEKDQNADHKGQDTEEEVEVEVEEAAEVDAAVNTHDLDSSDDEYENSNLRAFDNRTSSKKVRVVAESDIRKEKSKRKKAEADGGDASQEEQEDEEEKKKKKKKKTKT